MKCTLALTTRCNLACNYCYIGKHPATMDTATAQKAIDFVFGMSAPAEPIEIGFFGGEPLLEFELLESITGLIQSHPKYTPDRVTVSVTSNGTIYTPEIENFLVKNRVVLCMSCDGPPAVQDKQRPFPDGRGSSVPVERNLKKALEVFPLLPVNAVFLPENAGSLPLVLDYLSGLGIKNINLNPEIAARWTQAQTEELVRNYEIIGRKYLEYYRNNEPKYIDVIDSKITVIFRGGYQPEERCRFGRGEFAFTPSGNIYPCEKLIGHDSGGLHCLGNINNVSIFREPAEAVSGEPANPECRTCSLQAYCIHWCTCMNYHGSGRYDMVTPFICASERAALKVAFQVIKEIGADRLFYLNHVVGTPLLVTSGNPPPVKPGTRRRKNDVKN